MEYDLKKMTILVVDDTPDNISIIGEYLSPYQLKVATSGSKALQIAENTDLDLILLDIKMPDMDGYETCRRLKKNPKTKDIPVIFLTVMSDTTDKVKGFNLGAVDYITKPFQIDEVKSRIETHLTLNSYRKLLQDVNQELKIKVEERTRELLFAKDKAEEASRLKSYFLALMSHELRTPLAGIIGYTEILMEEIEKETLKDFAIGANQSAIRLKETFDSILNLSNFYAKKQTINLVPINLNERIGHILNHHYNSAELKKLNLIFFNEEEISTALDWAMFDIIFNNIVGNAIKYTEQGKIEIRLSKEKRNNNKYDCITVSDTGIGIPIEKQSTIFEEFRQGDEGMSRNFQGIGLGLSLVKKFVDLHDGILELTSSPGAGSSFKVLFPHVSNILFKEDKDDLNYNMVIPHSRTARISKILIVEKDPVNIKYEKLCLENLCEITIAEDGFTAIELSKRNIYDMILVNLNMGIGIPGIEVVKEIITKKLPLLDIW
jgi:signal transduction histidine kinase